MGSWTILNVEESEPNKLDMETTEKLARVLGQPSDVIMESPLQKVVSNWTDSSMIIEAWGNLTSEERGQVKRVYFVNANNTTDSASITIFENIDGDLEEIEEMQGYESARGADVAGRVNEKYGVYPRVMFG